MKTPDEQMWAETKQAIIAPGADINEMVTLLMRLTSADDVSTEMKFVCGGAVNAKLMLLMAERSYEFEILGRFMSARPKNRTENK